MVKVWAITMLLVACVADSFGSEPTPLMPHPPDRFNRPVFSQDRYKRTEPAEDPPSLDIKPKVFSQDKFENNERSDDYSDELRKVPEKGHEWSEIEIAKGIVSLNADHYAEAVRHFEKALEWDARNFVALEYISSVHERKGDVPNAIVALAKAKHIAPKGRWGQINFQLGRLYLMAKNYERSEIYLRLALDQGGQATAVNYTLGYLLYLGERFFEAERYLHEARMRATRRTALAPEREMLQAINYYLGEIYARLGFTQYAVVALRGTEVGDSWEIRQGAWRVHSELNHMNTYLALGAFAQYDTNVVVVPVSGALPVDFSSQGGAASVLTANAGWQTTPTAKWIAGVDGSLYLSTHLNSSLQGFDVLNLALDVWGSYWNQRDWAFVARYDYSNVRNDRRSFTQFQSTSGPVLSANYFPFQRWNWEFGFQYRANSFATDVPTGADQRSGHTSVGFLRASLRAPNPRFRPTLGYTFEADAADGLNFQARTHVLLAEADWRLFTATHLIGGLTFSKAYYPNHIQGRRDTIQQIRIGLTHLFSPHWVGVFDATQIEDDSTLGDFSYKRMITTCGLSYTF